MSNIDYEGYDPETVPRDLFKPHIYEPLYKLSPSTALSASPGIIEFTANSCTHPSWGRMFGGVCLAQTTSAVLQSLPPVHRPLFYLHQHASIWLRTGDDNLPITHRVTDLKVAKSYINKKVETYQDNQLIYIALVSLVSINERNTHQHSYPARFIDFKNLPPPDSLPIIGKVYQKIAEHMEKNNDKITAISLRGSINTMPFLVKQISHEDNTLLENWIISPSGTAPNGKPILKHPSPPRSLMYIKLPQSALRIFNAADPSTPTINYNAVSTPIGSHQAPLTLSQHLNMIALMYISDFMMIGQSIKPHADISGLPLNVQFSSLNHSVSIIQPNFDLFNDWLVFDSSAPYMTDSRGQLVGIYYRRDGQPIAYITQQTLARVHESADVASKYPNPYANKDAAQASAKL